MAYKFNTGNPVGPNGSADPRDLVDNAQVADRLINGSELTVPDRLGVQRRTWTGIQQAVVNYVNRGEWVTTTAYNVNDIWRDGPTGAFYLVLADYTSGASAAADIAGGNVVVHQPKDWVVSVASITDLLSAKQDSSQTVLVGSYHPGQFALVNPDNAMGGGAFKWAPAVPRTEHNGGTIISPTVPWSGARATLADFLAGAGETAPGASGCWVRVTDKVQLVDFGATIGVEQDSSASWSAANIYAASTHRTLYLPDGLVRVDARAVIDAAATGFSTVHLEGTFATTATRLGYIPSDCGSVIYTNQNTALEIRFNTWTAENFVIRGVGFVDSSHYPAGSPKSPNPALVVRKGNPDGSGGRYITGNTLESVAFNGYEVATEYIGMVAESVPNAALLNYIGPTTYRYANVGNCGDAIRLTDCTMNHLWVSNSTWFELTGHGIRLSKTVGGSGGVVDVTFNNMVFEGMMGPINTAGGISGGGQAGAGGYRNRLVLNSCNREFCGLYGPTEPNGFYSGSPLGYTGNTDVYIGGIWTEGLGYGEVSLPAIDADGTVSSTVPASVQVVETARVLTPETVNVAETIFQLPAGGTAIKNLLAGGSGGFSAELVIEAAAGALGVQRVYLSGMLGGGKIRDAIGTMGSGIVVTLTDGTSSEMCQVTIQNQTAFDIGVRLHATNTTGHMAYFA